MTAIDIVGRDAEGTAFSSQLGQRLRAARMRAKMSLREMARRSDVSASFVSQIELGRSAPSVGTLYAIASVLGVSLDSLMHGDESDDVGGGGNHASLEASKANMRPLYVSGTVPAVVTQQPEVGQLPGLQRACERPTLFLGGGVRWERLTSSDDPDVQFLRVTYEPGTESCPFNRLMTHNGKEYLHILHGQVEIQVAFARQILGPGDSLNFESNIPHRISNPFNDSCTALWVVIGRS